jgi:hypothetical protein
MPLVSIHLLAAKQRGMYHCIGVRACEYLDPEIAFSQYYNAGLPIFEEVEESFTHKK